MYCCIRSLWSTAQGLRKKRRERKRKGGRVDRGGVNERIKGKKEKERGRGEEEKSREGIRQREREHKRVFSLAGCRSAQWPQFLGLRSAHSHYTPQPGLQEQCSHLSAKKADSVRK